MLMSTLWTPDIICKARDLYVQLHSFTAVRHALEKEGIRVPQNTLQSWAYRRRPDGEGWPGFKRKVRL